MSRMVSGLMVVLCLLGGSRHADAQEGATGAFLSFYRPHRGGAADFEAGYRRHLDWHREHGDSLTWYGWTVIAGPGQGEFVDGAFGLRFAALDARVDPAGDARDMVENVEPFADPAARTLLRLRPELSTATPLEDAGPSRLVEVVRYTAPVGGEARLEAALTSLRDDAGAVGLLPYTVYEALVGDDARAYVVFVWRRALADYDLGERDPNAALRRRLADLPSAAAVTSTSELWLYRPDLTYEPEAEGSP